MSEEKAKAEMKPALSKMKKFYGLGTDGELTLLPLPSLLVFGCFYFSIGWSSGIVRQCFADDFSSH